MGFLVLYVFKAHKLYIIAIDALFYSPEIYRQANSQVKAGGANLSKF